jgi:hypothetical protein
MAELGAVFDATEIDPQTPFEVIPAGKYVAELVNSEMRPTKDGTSKYLWLEFEISDGSCKGRKLWDRLSLFHPDEQPRLIAQRSLSALCHATGKLRIQESEELHDIPVLLTVRVRPAKDGYDASNEIRGYSAIDGSSRTTAPTNDTAKPASAAMTKGSGYAWDRSSAA